MNNTAKIIGDLISFVTDGNYHSAAKYVGTNFVIRVTNRDRMIKRSAWFAVVVKVGKPNFLERRFIRACQKSGEPFPVKKIQLRAWSKRSR